MADHMSVYMTCFCSVSLHCDLMAGCTDIDDRTCICLWMAVGCSHSTDGLHVFTMVVNQSWEVFVTSPLIISREHFSNTDKV